VVFSYAVGTSEVLDCPGAHVAEGVTVFTRTLVVGPATSAATLLLTEVPAAGAAAAPRSEPDDMSLLLDRGVVEGQRTAVRVAGAPAAARLVKRGGRVELTVPPRNSAVTISIAIAAGADPAQLTSAVAVLPAAPDLVAWCRGGPSRWPSLVTTSKPGTDSKAYAVDTIVLPVDNPWKSWMRPIAHDFFRDGRCAISTMGGDVWIASNIDQRQVTWKRFATGLFEPLGLRIVDDRVFVLCRDQLARLDDLDGDGEADAYISFNRAIPVHPRYNDFTIDLVNDRAGNFYVAKGGHGNHPRFPFTTALVRISPDGRTCEAIATGLRVPSGLGMGPQDQLTCADNQGNWIPACRLNLVRPGGWYGYVGNPTVYGKTIPDHPERADPPLCWIPMAADNCPGSQVWAPAGWGPLSGLPLHLSYGQSSLLAVLHETVDGVAQGGVVKVPLSFASGIMRGRFNPADGQLYVSGLKGWQTNGALDGCLQRVRWTGKGACLPISLAVQRGVLRLGFSAPLDPASVTADNVALQRWNYAWTAAYGSPDISFADPERKGRDDLAVGSVLLEPDGRTVVIAVPDLAVVMQQGLTVKFADTDGEVVKHTIYHTINSLR
jgi:hypothetical protein